MKLACDAPVGASGTILSKRRAMSQIVFVGLTPGQAAALHRAEPCAVNFSFNPLFRGRAQGSAVTPAASLKLRTARRSSGERMMG
jgi:hypothetical protein